MLNYISAELYKLRFHKGLFIGEVILLGLETLVFLPGFILERENYIPREVLLAFLLVAMLAGFFIAPIFAAMAFDDQHGRATLKNEIVYGIPRRRIYLGKLAAGAMVGTVCAALAIGWYLLLTFLVGKPSGEFPDLWGYVLTSVTTYWLVWLAAYAFSFFLLASLRNPSVALIAAYLTTLIVAPLSLAGAWENSHLWWRLAMNLFFAAPVRYILDESYSTGLLLPLVGGSVPLYALVVCLFWYGATTALGLFILRRREIR